MKITNEPEIMGGIGDTDSFTFLMSDESGWMCELFGMGDGLTWHPQSHQVPCWFWRKMQRIFFGNKWIKVK